MQGRGRIIRTSKPHVIQASTVRIPSGLPIYKAGVLGTPSKEACKKYLLDFEKLMK
jgi:hypothetical protein